MKLRHWTTLTLAVLSIAAYLPGADTLSGAGATFPAPLYQKWLATYQKKNPEISMQYRPIGSGAGIEALSQREVDFAASDYPLSGQLLAGMGRGIRQIPSVAGGLVPAYHLEGVIEDVRFTPETLAAIYLGKLRKWNDRALKAVNPGVHLPARDIIVIHRSERSGSTFVWTNYLAKTNPEWQSSVGSGDMVRWPVGAGAEGNEGVAAAIAKTPDSIGYVEFIYALTHKLDYGAVRNSAGRFVQADLPSLQAAAEALELSGPRTSMLPIANAPGPDSYPIASLTYLLVPDEWASPAKRAAMLEFLTWILTAGQKQAASLGYVALPPGLSKQALEVVEQMRSAGAR